MSATNSTTHYNLPSFLGTDKPAWLVDWNGAMATIDSAIYEAKQAADTAGTAATAVASDLATLSGTVSTQGSTISTLSETLTTAVGNINTINSLIGNGTPTTTDQTIIGAINEINARTGEADGISYDNTDSGLTATNVQGAIDEVNTSLGKLKESESGEKTLTVGDTSLSSNMFASASVTFTKTYSKPPIVICEVDSSAPGANGAVTSYVTTTGCHIGGWRYGTNISNFKIKYRVFEIL